jgi:hypothetical protein
MRDDWLCWRYGDNDRTTVKDEIVVCVRTDIIFVHFANAVYTRISYFYDWIEETACENFPDDTPSYMNCMKVLGVETDAPTDMPIPSPTMAPPTSSPVRPNSPPEPISSASSGSTLPDVQFVGLSPKNVLGNCMGDCDSDDDCAGTLKCFERDELDYETYLVPGCAEPVGISKGVDICYNPSAR